MERILQEQIEEQDYQLDDLDDLEEQTIFSPLDDAQIKIFKIGTIVFYLVAYFYTAILVQLKTIYSLPVTIGLLLSTEFLIKKLHTTSIPLKEGAKKLETRVFFTLTIAQAMALSIWGAHQQLDFFQFLAIHLSFVFYVLSRTGWLSQGRLGIMV